MCKRKAEQGLTAATATARAEAMEECADHMEQHWTDDAEELRAGQWLAQSLRVEAYTWRMKAANLLASRKTPNAQHEAPL